LNHSVLKSLKNNCINSSTRNLGFNNGLNTNFETHKAYLKLDPIKLILFSPEMFNLIDKVR